MVISSWRQQACMRRSWRLFTDPLSTNNMKDASCSLISWHSTSPSSLKYLFGTRRDGLCPLSQRRRSVFLRPRPRPQVSMCPKKDASVKCLDAVLGKVHLPCFIVVLNGLGFLFWHSISLSVSVACLLSFYVVTIRGKVLFFRDSRWFLQARKPLLTACGGMAKSARCCPPSPSRRFAKRMMEQWALHSQGTIAFCPHTLRKTVLSSSFFLLVLLSCPRDCLLDVSRLFGLICVATGTL